MYKYIYGTSYNNCNYDLYNVLCTPVAGLDSCEKFTPIYSMPIVPLPLKTTPTLSTVVAPVQTTPTSTRWKVNQRPVAKQPQDKTNRFNIGFEDYVNDLDEYCLTVSDMPPPPSLKKIMPRKPCNHKCINKHMYPLTYYIPYIHTHPLYTVYPYTPTLHSISIHTHFTQYIHTHPLYTVYPYTPTLHSISIHTHFTQYIHTHPLYTVYPYTPTLHSIFTCIYMHTQHNK